MKCVVGTFPLAGAFLYYYAPGVPVDPVRNTSQGIKIPIPSPA